MKLHNIKDSNEQVTFAEALKRGLGKNQGLFFPNTIPVFSQSEINALLEKDFVSRSQAILAAFIGDELANIKLEQGVKKAFTFPLALAPINNKIYALELFHGPTLAFKDFGARFMAQSLAAFSKDEPITILTATSGDTGAAVAHAFYGMDNIKVVILYPKGKISPLQEKLFCTLGGNVHTLAIEGDFDDCQALVKKAFDDDKLCKQIGLNSANSINISRLLAQVCYYFEALALCPKEMRGNLVVSVPSGNFGNLTAGLIAKAMGLPIKRFIAATNANDTVARYLLTQNWSPKKTVATLSNAMDVSQPNNWPRIAHLFKMQQWDLFTNHLKDGADASKLLTASVFSDAETALSLHALFDQGYLCEPHGAIAYRALTKQLAQDEIGIFLCTAHPAKFKTLVDDILSLDIPLPAPLEECKSKPLLSLNKKANFDEVREYLLAL